MTKAIFVIACICARVAAQEASAAITSAFRIARRD